MSGTTCPFCGGPTTTREAGCGACPLGGSCELLCCTACGYRTVAGRSVIVELFRRFLRREGHGDGAPRVP